MINFTKMKIKFIIILLLIFPNFLFAQDIFSDTALPEVMPGNPDQFRFLKYGQVPVSKYTGLPQIQIPIYNIETKGLDIPLKLTYIQMG